MKITSVIVTFNRLELLPRALTSIKNQIRKPDHVYVISNSTRENYYKEKEICTQFGFELFRNNRTENYAGALNTAIEEIVKRQGIADDLYFASLDDDDVWLPEYLHVLEEENAGNYDLLATEYLRLSSIEKMLMTLPTELSANDFLKGNPGIGGSNTFIRLKTMLTAGSFDEGLDSSVDRDFFVRVFQQRPTYKCINKHLVTAHTDKDRERLTTNRKKKKSSLQTLLFKHQHLMSESIKEKFFIRARNYFNIEQSEIELFDEGIPVYSEKEIEFQSKGKYQFVIGFIAGNEIIAERIAEQIVNSRIPVDLVLIIEDVPKIRTLHSTEKLLEENHITYSIIKDRDWKENLRTGHYGSYFQQFTEINSIPLGRTILHHHLFTATTTFENPVYWIIDDDVSFTAISAIDQKAKLFDFINGYIGKADAIIGSISMDPPVPVLCCIRSQLLDYYHSLGNATPNGQRLDVLGRPDYYYDLSDLHSDHLETPIYHSKTTDEDLRSIFSGKAISRPALQRQLKAENKTITRRGANTLILNREMLRYYPVINLEVNNRFARRGDLLWALFNQVVSGRIIFEHTFSVDHNRPIVDFDLDKELDKVAYDIIGYSFNKALLTVIETIKNDAKPHRPKDIFETLLQKEYYQRLLTIYTGLLKRRKARFLMNYYRIIGLTKLISEKTEFAKPYYSQLRNESKISTFDATLNEAQDDQNLKTFTVELKTAIWAYSKSVTEIAENQAIYQKQIQEYFRLNTDLQKLGSGAEGVIFTDEQFVYKIFFNILDKEWAFIKEISNCFSGNELLETIEFFEDSGFRFIRYPFHDFKPLGPFEIGKLISFLKFSKQNGFVYTNVKPGNFIQTNSGLIKLVDYGKSFEPFNNEKFLNSIKRTFLLWKCPEMQNENFQKLTNRINIGDEPMEIKGWQALWRAVTPRKKEELLDKQIISLIKAHNPKEILDFGAGKCKTAKQLKSSTGAQVYVYDINKKLLKKHCSELPICDLNGSPSRMKFDIVLLNLVLCEVDDKTVHSIMDRISFSLKNSGKVFISVCNPDFAHIHKTEFQNRLTIPESNSAKEIITKTCNYTKNNRTEYHRPTDWYVEMCEQHDLKLIETIDTDGIDIETLETISDFKILVLANAN